MARPNRGYRISDKPNDHGAYEIVWSENGRGKRRSTGCSNIADAQQVLAAFLQGLGAPKARRGLVSECLVSYWRRHVLAKVSGTETTFYDIKALAAHFCDFTTDLSFKQSEDYFDALAAHTGGLTVKEVTDARVGDFIAKRRAGRVGQPATNGGIRRNLITLTAALNRAAKAKLIDAGDVPFVDMPPPPDPRDRWLTDAERDKLLAAAQAESDKRLSRAYRFVALAIGTASRKGALVRLTWFQIDLERRVVYLNPQGRRQTNKRRPTVPIADWLLPLLVRAHGEKTGEYVLDHPGSIRTTFDTAVERSGLEGVTPHVLRHTWATRAAQNGVPIQKIAQVMGDSIATVIKNYLHHYPEDLREAVEHWTGLQAPMDAADEM